jgi:hypothetical protein
VEKISFSFSSLRPRWEVYILQVNTARKMQEKTPAQCCGRALTHQQDIKADSVVGLVATHGGVIRWNQERIHPCFYLVPVDVKQWVDPKHGSIGHAFFTPLEFVCTSSGWGGGGWIMVVVNGLWTKK